MIKPIVINSKTADIKNRISPAFGLSLFTPKVISIGFTLVIMCTAMLKINKICVTSLNRSNGTRRHTALGISERCEVKSYQSENQKSADPS